MRQVGPRRAVLHCLEPSAKLAQPIIDLTRSRFSPALEYRPRHPRWDQLVLFTQCKQFCRRREHVIDVILDEVHFRRQPQSMRERRCMSQSTGQLEALLSAASRLLGISQNAHHNPSHSMHTQPGRDQGR
jgi:hypothetical protein